MDGAPVAMIQEVHLPFPLELPNFDKFLSVLAPIHNLFPPQGGGCLKISDEGCHSTPSPAGSNKISTYFMNQLKQKSTFLRDI